MTYEELTGRLSRRTEKPGWNYAVLVPLVEEGDKLSLLFEVRAATLRHQPGEVCFPGGAAEPGESPEETALRETAEELGLGREKIELGPRLPRRRHQAGFYTWPVVGRLLPGWREALKPNAAEVGEVFTVPLDFFRETPPEEYTCEVVTVPPADFPQETAVGALGLYISNQSVTAFQPMNINFGIMPPLGHRVKGKRNKNAELSRRSLEIIEKLRAVVLE